MHDQATKLAPPALKSPAVRPRAMASDPEWRKLVVARAWHNWQGDGRPYGHAGDYWLAAEVELLRELDPIANKTTTSG